ncbi:methyl-accepting chemotaxis protein [Massilia agilis]|uniref:Methyl-accepting chemotaxis protein n=1 Tax=Massilia agilis TaxID=1811226 RepID=A0ABT2DEF6_9BURK|nr:methyl-accepting chemotaxis protein [Massilia agilis]MCS0809552.1 methyl-accepting chemotaxis protein [Massilia agilis]
MMRLDDLKIGTRMGASYALLCLLMTLLTGVGMWLLRDFGARSEEMMTDALAKVRIINDWRAATELNGMRTTIMITSDNEAERAALAPQIKQTSARISNLQKQLEQLVEDAEGKALYASIGTRRKAYIALRDSAFKARADGNTHEAATIARGDMAAAQKAYVDEIDSLVEHARAMAAGQAAQVKARGAAGQKALGALWLGALVVAVSSAVLAARSIGRPLAHAVEVTNAVAQGRLHNREERHAHNETGQLLAALNRMNRDLYRVVGKVRDSSAAIASASGEIAHGNVDLSARTEQQASSLEETAASVEELTSTVKQNAAHARHASQLASNASGVAAKGGELVAQVVGSMDAINTSARRITDIIGVIDGIAFQTNILALNAAVEAARAGEQGRGFAVVASEVRNLAQRSASAAKEIKALIEVSVQEVGTGSSLVGKAGATMEEIVSSVHEVSAIMQDIALASSEQEAGIGQLSQAISGMDAMTQQNAALVEQAAAASETLREQALELEEAVRVFQLEQDATVHPLNARGTADGRSLALAA